MIKRTRTAFLQVLVILCVVIAALEAETVIRQLRKDAGGKVFDIGHTLYCVVSSK